MDTFINKTIVITGAGAGIGRATALAFARKQGNVVVSDIAVAAGEETVDLIKKEGGEATFIEADVTSLPQIKNLMQQAVHIYGSLDVGINNAGIGGPFKRTAEYLDEDWEKVIAINQTGVFHCMREQLKIMLAQEKGAIVNVSSIAGLRGMENTCAYVASKHAVLGLTKTAGREYARQNIRINAVCPVFTKSALIDQIFDVNPAYEDILRKAIPMRRFGETEDIANAILWLSADAASFVTGLCLPIDGGLTA